MELQEMSRYRRC